MAVMNPMGGGIDSAVTQRMQRMQNDPNALGQQAQKSGDILDLIAARRAADLVAEQKKLLALQMNGSPSTIKDQVGEELVASQKEQMKGPLQDLRGRTQGVGGVLENQQMQGAPTMAAAQGGIINTPAPNLTRMYNGGIVGYAGPDGSEVSSLNAYLKRLGIDPSRVKDATDAELANIKAAVEREMQKDRDKGAGLLAPPSDAFSALLGVPGSTESEAQRLDIGERAAARGKPLRGEAAINPPADDRNVREAERLRGLKSFEDTDYVNEGYYNINDKGSLDSYLATMEDPKFGAKGKDQFAQGAPNIAEGLDDFAKYPKFNKKTEVKTDGNKPTSAVKQLEDKVNKGFDPFASATTGAGAGAGIAGIKPNRTVPSGGPVPQQSPLMTPQQQAEARPKPKTPVELLQERLDKMDGKKGIAGLVERFANTDFQKSYGGTGEALAQAGRDIAKTGKDEKAANRKFLEGQLGVQQSIEAADVAAGRDREKFDITEGRLSETMTAANKNAVADIALRSEIAQRDSLNNLAKLNLDTVNSKGAQDYRMAALELQKQENTIREQGNTTAVQNVVKGYVTAATSFYKGLLANATQAEATAIKQELRAEIGRIVGMVGTNGAIDLSVLMQSAGAAPADTGGFAYEGEEA